MSPVWVKLGDFGVSKRILAQATTTLHTQVSTQVYSAPEVLGLDSNSETSDYTNAVDIWSLGCVIFELLVGTKLFLLEGQVSRYFFGKWPFPEDQLIGLSPPMDNPGISLLKSMLVIQPEDRPTATGALRNTWLIGFKSDSEDSGDDQDMRIQSHDRSTLNRKRKSRLATYNEPKKRRSERNPVTQEGIRCIPGGVTLEANVGSQIGGDPTFAESTLGTSMMTISTESLVVEVEPRKSGFVSHDFQATHSGNPKPVRKKQTGHIPQACHQSMTQNTTLTLLTKRVANEN